MSLQQKICDAKNCAANMAYCYTVASSCGEDTDNMLYELLEINAYIRTLERYLEAPCSIKETKDVTLISGENILVDDGKELYLTTETDTEIDYCLSEADADKIIEQIHLICNTCNC